MGAVMDEVLQARINREVGRIWNSLPEGDREWLAISRNMTFDEITLEYRQQIKKHQEDYGQSSENMKEDYRKSSEKMLRDFQQTNQMWLMVALFELFLLVGLGLHTIFRDSPAPVECSSECPSPQTEPSRSMEPALIPFDVAAP